MPPIPRQRDTIPSERDGMPLLRMQTLGAARLQLGEFQLGLPAGILFTLVLRLVYTPGMAVPRDVLLREIWPSHGDVRRRGNLRQALYKLRSMGLEVALIGTVVHLQRVQLAPTFTVERTAELFERDVVRGAEPFGPFVPGFTPPSAELAEWLEATREGVHADVRRVLVEQLRQRRERADWGGAEVLSRWLLQFDPLNEDATLTLAECTMLSGAKMEAVAILDRYLADLGPQAGDIRLPATQLRKRFTEPPARKRPSLASTERHFVGRQQELAELTLSMRRARWHDGSAVLLHGPAGIGKTRIVTELGKVAQIEGYREVSLECRESDQLRPLGPFLEALPELMASPGALGCSPESMTVLRKLLGEVAREEEGEGAGPSRDHVDATLRSIRSRSIRHAIVDLMAAISDEKPIYLSVEDSHWIDTYSWELLVDLMQRLRSMRVFALVTSRFSSVRADRPERIPINLTVGKLPPLEPDESRDLARSIATDLAASIPPHVEDWIVSAGEGTPLMVRALLEHWTVTGDSGGIPPTLMSLLEQRLDRLSPTALRALQCAALLGRLASLDRIRTVLQLPTHELLRALEELETAACLANSDASLVVSHSLIGRAATERLSSLVDAALHASIAEMFEAEYLRTGDSATLLETIEHLHASGQLEKVGTTLVDNAEVLAHVGRPQTVLLAAIDTIREFPVYEGDKTLLRLITRLEAESGAFENALQASPGGFSRTTATALLTEPELDERVSYIEAAYRLDPIIDRAELGLAAADIVSRTDVSTDIRIRAADIGLVIAANTCDPSLAAACFEPLALADRDLVLNDSARRLGILFHAPFGSFAQAQHLAEASYERARSGVVTAGMIVELGRAGYVFRMMGLVAPAIAAFSRARTIALDIASPRLAEYPVWQLAQMALEDGDLSLATNFTEELERISSRGAGTSANSYVDGHLCLLSLSSGNRLAARDHLARCVSSLPRIAPLRSLSYTMALDLAVKLADKHWKPEESYLSVALERFTLTERFCASDLLAAGLGAAMLRVGKRTEARDRLQYYLSHCRREACPPQARLSGVLRQLGLATP